jgi:nucleoside-diphosphate-sugar epimerase
MRVLVTGANGFIGSHLTEFLVSKDCQVRCLLKKGDTTPPFTNSTNVEWIEGDLIDRASLFDATKDCELVFHAAAISRYHAGIPEADYRRVNVEGTQSLLEACLMNSVNRLVYISSIEAVGLSKDGKPLNESSEPYPRNVYGKSKLDAEKTVQKFTEEHGMESVVVRIATTYGPRELMLFKRIFKPASKGFYCVFGDGSALVEFAYVKNQVQGIWLAAQKGRSGSTYFISDTQSYPFQQVIRQIGNALGKRFHLIHLPLPISWIAAAGCEGLGRIFRFYPFFVKETGRPPFSRETLKWAAKSAIFCDTAKARTELGHTPTYSLQQGIEETVTWYRSQGWL